MAYLTQEELQKIGFKSVGKNVQVSTRAALYGVGNISIGDNVRIDDFCLLSAVGGFINLHSHIHVAAYSSIFGKGGVTMEDFSGISAYVSLYSASDNYGGDYLVGPTMDEEFRGVIEKPIVMGKYTTCGSHAVVLPGVTMQEGSILGASSLAIKSLEPWATYSGIPAKFIKERKKGLIEKAVLMEQRWKAKN